MLYAVLQEFHVQTHACVHVRLFSSVKSKVVLVRAMYGEVRGVAFI